MRIPIRGRWRASLPIAGALALVASSSALAGNTAVRVSHGDLYAGCTVGGANFTPKPFNYPSAEVEPYVAVNPANHQNVIGVWQQDRWSDGGALGLAAGYSFDGGKTWADVTLPFSTCAHGLPYQRASDPWVSIGPDGVAYTVSISFDETTARGDVAVATSHNGGRTWGDVHELIVDTNINFFNDKESVTADPVHPGVAYVLWDRVDVALNNQPSYLSKTVDGGKTWSAPQRITSNAPNQGNIGEILVIDPRTDTLYDVYAFGTFAPDGTTLTASERIKRSTDQGATWSAPVGIGTDQDVGDFDPITGALLRTGAGKPTLPDVAIDRTTGQLYVVWEDARFSGGQFDEVALSTSKDGGATWSKPIRVNTPSGGPAFTPMVAVNDDGTVGVSYYDFRTLFTSDPATLPTNYWLATSPRGGAAFTHEAPIAQSRFDLLSAPYAFGYFLGDYQGLVTSGDDFLALFGVATGSINGIAVPSNRTDILFNRVTPAGASALAPATAAAPTNGAAHGVASSHNVPRHRDY